MANAEKVAKAGVTREPGWLYYIDKAGNIARSKMVRGGQKKKPGDKAEVVAKTGVTRDNNFIYYMDDAGDVALGIGAAHFGQVHEHHIAQRVLRMHGDADSGRGAALGLDPFVIGRVLQAHGVSR